MRSAWVSVLVWGAVALLVGCGVHRRHGLVGEQLRQLECRFAGGQRPLSRELERDILALNPTNITAEQVRHILARAPAPRIVNLHGGLAKVIPRMASFSEFLIGMGYPAVSLTNPNDGTYSFSCYESSEKLAGVMAWFYEKEGLRPMLVGHSQGGIQVVKVLYQLAQKPTAQVPVWNPLTWTREDRYEIVDPLTGTKRPVVGLELPYATAVGAGGLTRVLPNQWDMNLKLRTIPDSVVEFTGFCKRFDLLGGDLLGYGPANHYRAHGKAVVRNVWLPTEYKHGSIPDTQHLLQSQEIRDWIDHYRPEAELIARPQLDRAFDADSAHILWAAEVWYSIKKHWALELQRYINADTQTRHDR
jgi:hypothetical protein